MQDLIYDRVQSDIDNKTSKARFMANDLNRIEEWCKLLADLLTKYGYPVNIITKTDWTRNDFRTVSVNERIRTNVAAIKDAYFTIASTPTLPSTLNKIDIAKANAIEKILFDIDNLLTYMESSFVYAGVGSCGQSRIWQRRFRLGKTHAEVKTWANIIKIYWNEFSETDTWEVFE